MLRLRNRVQSPPLTSAARPQAAVIRAAGGWFAWQAARLVAALPLSLEVLEIVASEQLSSLPDLSALTQLRTLHLGLCVQLALLSDLSALTFLRKRPSQGRHVVVRAL